MEWKLYTFNRLSSIYSTLTISLLFLFLSASKLYEQERNTNQQSETLNKRQVFTLNNLDYQHEAAFASIDSDFTIILFPDIQTMVESYPSIWMTMPKWVSENKTKLNIKAVIGLGDNVNVCNDKQMVIARNGWNIIDNTGLPYIICIGNHDYDFCTDGWGRVGSKASTLFNKYFGINTFKRKTWFGSAYQDSTQNSYINFTIGGQKYLILNLEFYPRNEILTWAQDIINNNSDAKIIIATHAYLLPDGSLSSYNNLNIYNLLNDNAGQQMWDKFVKVNPSIFLVVNGHYGNDSSITSAYLNSSGVKGNTVNQLFVNHQYDTLGGCGFMQILKFHPLLRTIETCTYSGYLNSYDQTGSYLMPWPLVYTPTLSSPLNNQKDLPTTIMLSWNKTLYADNYELQVSKDPDYTSIFSEETELLSDSKNLDGLKDGARYYWRVRSKNNYGVSSYSESRSFSTELAAPENLQAVNTEDNYVNLTWFDMSEKENGYVIERSLENSIAYKIVDTTIASVDNFLDSTVTSGKAYKYRIYAFNDIGYSKYSNSASVTTKSKPDSIIDGRHDHNIIKENILFQNFPNPFNPVTLIKYQISRQSFVQLKVYDQLGQELVVLVNEEQDPGSYSVRFNVSGLPSGIYFYKIFANNFIVAKKMIVLK
jgi:hypothetical protein